MAEPAHGAGTGAGPESAPESAPEDLCGSADLPERGRAWVWDVLAYGQPARAFALRVDGVPQGWLNRCAHVPVEMDWQPGEFLDADRRWIVCSIHGASYDPTSGRCMGGPCGRGRLVPVTVREAAGRVSWYPSRDIRPLRFDGAASPPAPG
jgi:nitrite reductase/ring-hydroxylating ferredoxin subunit